MPRAPRVQVAGGIYHVTARGNRRQAIFQDDDDRKRFLQVRDRVARRYGWRIHACCLMTNHFHLLVETPDANLSRGMQRLNSEYARYFNTRFAHVGHLFQQRFVSRLIESEQFFVEVLRYIARSTPSAQAFVSILQIGRGAASAERGVSDTTSE